VEAIKNSTVVEKETIHSVTNDQIVSEGILDTIKTGIDDFLDGLLAPQPVEKKPVDKVASPTKPPKAPTPAKKVTWGSYTPKPYSWASTKFEDGYMQPSGMTKEERYPKIYDSAASLKPKAKRVLSFGCSTGEEVFALAKRFPNAERLVGVDLDINRIRDARKTNKQKNVYFYDTAAGLGTFDVVTALNVFFCLEKPIPKDGWTKTLEEAASYVAPGGILMIFKSAYDPMDVLGKDFKAENTWMHKHNRNEKDYFCGYYRRKSMFWW
jgi:SAM-dependent methyltransferase